MQTLFLKPSFGFWQKHWCFQFERNLKPLNQSIGAWMFGLNSKGTTQVGWAYLMWEMCQVFWWVQCHDNLADAIIHLWPKRDPTRHPTTYLYKVLPNLQLFIYLFKVFIGLWWVTMNERHRPTHHPLDAHYYSIVDKLQLS